MGQALNLRFLIDEDVPRSTAKILTEAGYDAVDVRDIGLRGKSDIEIFRYAQKEERLIISCDLGLANTIQFPPKKHFGIIVVRIPDYISITRFNEEVLGAVNGVGEGLIHHLAIIEIGRVRLREA